MAVDLNSFICKPPFLANKQIRSTISTWTFRSTIKYIIQHGAPFDSVQLPYKWLNPMVYDGMIDITIVFMGFINQQTSLKGTILTVKSPLKHH